MSHNHAAFSPLFDYYGASKEVARIVRVASEWDFTPVFWRLRSERLLSVKYFAEADLEIRRYLCLVGLERKPLAMASKVIDEVWHQFVLFTSQYRAFCEKCYGEYLEHIPHSPTFPIPVTAGRSFACAYRRVFGPLPEIWLEGMPADLRRYYQNPEKNGVPKRWASIGCLASEVPSRLRMPMGLVKPGEYIKDRHTGMAWNSVSRLKQLT